MLRNAVAILIYLAFNVLPPLANAATVDEWGNLVIEVGTP